MRTIDPDELAQVVQALERSKARLDALVVRGVRTAGPGELDELDALRHELDRVGAHHLAQRMTHLVAAMRSDAPEAGRALLRTQTSLHLFDRILTMEVVGEQLAATVTDHEPNQVPDPAPNQEPAP